MNKCNKCKQYIYNDVCNCEKYEIYYPESFGEEKEIRHGYSFAGVIEQLAISINDDYELGEIFEEPVEITHQGGVTKKFKCYAEAEIHYRVSEVKENIDGN